MRGEHSVPSVGYESIEGSSPRVRGACIGTRHRPRGHRVSPRVRGAFGLIGDGEARERVIPARAGSILTSCMELWPHEGHPRACGEHSSPRTPSCGSCGSSPRVRGAYACCQTHEPNFGVIPARAGSIFLVKTTVFRSMGHPRACGEHQSCISVACATVGSSPRVRGAYCRFMAFRFWDGVIPARAGSMEHLAHLVAAVRGHPRACGEHRIRQPSSVSSTGSSPRVRGA